MIITNQFVYFFNDASHRNVNAASALFANGTGPVDGSPVEFTGLDMRGSTAVCRGGSRDPSRCPKSGFYPGLEHQYSLELKFKCFSNVTDDGSGVTGDEMSSCQSCHRVIAVHVGPDIVSNRSVYCTDLPF